MAVPPKSQQIQRVADFLSDERNDDRSAAELAGIVVNGMYDMWARGMESVPLVPHVGMAFKIPWISSPQFVAWIGDEFGKERIWVIDSTTDYGFMTTRTADVWKIATPSSAKAGGPGANADGWESGMKVSLSQGRAHLSILQVGIKAVLMRNDSDLSLWAESNANMKKYYKKEKK